MLNPQAQVRGPEQPPGVAPGRWAARSLLACNLGLSFFGRHPDVGPGLQPLSVLVRAPTSGLPPTGTTYPQAARPGVMLKRGLPGIGAGEAPGAPRSWPLQHSSSVLLASAHYQRRSRRRPSARLVQSRLSTAPRRPACARCLGPVTHLPRPSNCLLGTLAWRVPQLASSAGSSHSCPFSSRFVPIGEVRSSVSTPSQAYVAITGQSPAHLAPIVTGA